MLVTDDGGATDTDTVSIVVTAAVVPNRPPETNTGADQTIASGESFTLDGQS